MINAVYSLLNDLGITGTDPITPVHIILICLFAMGLTFVSEFVKVIVGAVRRK